MDKYDLHNLKPKKILIVRTDRIGDVALTLPSIRAVREHFKGAQVDVLINPYTHDLVDKNPYISHVIHDDRQGQHKGVLGLWKLVSQLRREQYDVVIIYHTKRRTNLICFLAGIPVRIGYKDKKWGFLLTHPLTDERHLGKKHEIEYCLSVLKSFGIEGASWDMAIPIDQDAEQWVKNLFLGHKIPEGHKKIVIHPGASDPTKRWPEYRFAELMTMIQEHYPSTFIMIGGKDVQPAITTILRGTQATAVNLSGKTTLAQLISVLNNCHVLISNDSGPLHIGSGLGIPVVAIFTRNQAGINPERWGPVSPLSRTITVPENYDLSFKKARAIDPSCLESITAREVFEAVDSIFKVC